MLIKGHHQLLISANLFLFSGANPQATSLIVLSDCYVPLSHSASTNSKFTSARHGRVSPGALLSTLGPTRSYSIILSLRAYGVGAISPLLLLLSLSFRGALQSPCLSSVSPSKIILFTHTYHRDYRRV